MNGLGVRYVALWCLLLGQCQGDNDRWPRNLLCYNDYIEEMRCTWEVRPGDNCSAEYILEYNQTLGIITNGNVTPYQIHSHRPSVPDLCVCNILTIFALAMEYQIHVKYMGDEVLSTTLIPAQTIKPLPPHNLTVSSSQGKIQHLMWEDDYTKETYLEKSLQYQVSYNRLRHKVSDGQTVNLTSGKRLSLLGYLDGGFTYTLRVRARPIDNYDGIWSNWSCEKEWTEGFPDHNLDSIIAPICVGVVLLIIICHFFIKWLKRDIWDKIPVPKVFPPFNKFQEYFFDEKQLESCMVDMLVCSGPRGGILWESGPDSCPSIPSVPIFPLLPPPNLQLLLPFPHELSLGPRAPAPLFPAFPTMWPGLPTNSGPRAGDQPGGRATQGGYSQFNSLVKPKPEGREGEWGEEGGRWAGEEGEEEEEVIEDRDTPLMLSPYSLGLTETPSSGYNSRVVSAGQSEASDYRPFDQLGVKPIRATVTGPKELWGAPETPWPQGPGALFPVPFPALGGWLEAGAGAGFGKGLGWRECWPGVSGQMDGKWDGTCLDLGVKGKCHPGIPEGEATPYMKLSLVGNEQSQACMKLHPTAPQETPSYRVTQQ